jgi:hypothetical protein
MSMHLVPLTTLEELEHALLARQIGEKAAELEQLQAQLAPLERAFAAFEQRVARQSAPITAERDALRHLCNEIERFTARLHARLVADPDGFMADVFTPDELRYIGELFGIAVPEDWVAPESHTTTFDAGWECADPEEDPPLAQPGKARENESPDLRSLYRQLARTFHPDLTRDEHERRFREEMMLRINAAWELRDLPTMQAIRNDVGDLLSGQLLSASAYRLAWQKRELAHLVLSCARCSTRLATLRSSKTITLWYDSTLAGAAIARHIGRLEQEVVQLGIRRERVVEEFRLALATFAAHLS